MIATKLERGGAARVDVRSRSRRALAFRSGARLGAWTRALLSAALAIVVLGGCAHAPRPGSAGTEPPPTEASGPAEAELPAGRAVPAPGGLREDDAHTQSLFRVQYEGPEGSGALRLVLKVEGPERYLVETRDRFGRLLWRIEGSAERNLLVDDRLRLYCASEEGIRIPEIALEALPLEDLPGILLDRLPGGLVPLEAPGGEAGEAAEYRDRRWRRWTVTGPVEEPTAWTYWESGEPRMWWRREAPGEAVLSHRAGTQLRWKRVASEPMAGALETLELDASYQRIACSAWPERLRAGADS